MTLVRAVVEAGAVYYSDEHAMLDEVGRVHPYARPLPFRPPEGRPVDLRAEALGGVVGTEPELAAVLLEQLRAAA